MRVELGECALDHAGASRRRREESLPALRAKFERAILIRLPPHSAARILRLFDTPLELAATPVHEFMNLWTGP